MTSLEDRIRHLDPSLEKDDGDEFDVMRMATATARSGIRSQLESASALLPLLAVSGSVAFATAQRLSTIKAAEEFGDPELS